MNTSDKLRLMVTRANDECHGPASEAERSLWRTLVEAVGNGIPCESLSECPFASLGKTYDDADGVTFGGIKGTQSAYDPVHYAEVKRLLHGYAD